MKLLYSLGVNLYTFGIRIASLWNPKAKKWVKGRTEVWEKINSFKPARNVYWFHCASLGEFEQGRPLMELLKKEESCQIVLTFFSPSGYEVRKKYEGADLIIYLPKDARKNARKFLEAIKPKQVFFIKYEFWAHYINTCKLMSIPIYSVSAIFRKEQIFFKWHGGFMRQILKSFDMIFVQNQASQTLLEKIGIHSIVTGDTRYDRVAENAANVQSFKSVQNFCEADSVLICGSIWKEDLDVIRDKIKSLENWKVIIAPHEISVNFINEIIKEIGLSSTRYSELKEDDKAQVLIIDNVGMLMHLYQYGQLAFVGGGFRTGLHNILEPAAFGLPVIFGNKHEKFPEAQEFIDSEIGFAVSSPAEFSSTFDRLIDQNKKQEVLAFMNERRGATQKIMTSLY